MTLKYPECPYCKALRRELPEEVTDVMINDYHESKIGREDFPKEVQGVVIEIMGRGRKLLSKPEFPCTRCVEAEHCRVDLLFVDCSALDAYKRECRRRKYEKT